MVIGYMPATGCSQCSGTLSAIERYVSSVDRFKKMTRLDDLSDVHIHPYCDELMFESSTYSGVLIRRDEFVIAFLKKNKDDSSQTVKVLVELYQDSEKLENVFSVYEEGDTEAVSSMQAVLVMKLAHELNGGNHHSISDIFSQSDVTFNTEGIDIMINGKAHHFPRNGDSMSRYAAYAYLRDIDPVMEYVQGNGLDPAQKTILQGMLNGCKQKCYEVLHTGNFTGLDLDDDGEPRDVFPHRYH
ncbi:MAG: hypothetical protein V1729_05070 [Candidatus Woesearchaeota archaeon]